MRLYSTPLATTYHANTASCASLCTLLYAAALLLVPWPLAYAAGGLWLKEASVRERPLVRFSHEVLVEGYGVGVESRFGWSTSFELNDALAHRLRPCELRAWSDDADRDGVPEELHFALSVPLVPEGGGDPLPLHALSVVVGLVAHYGDDAHAPFSVHGAVLAEAWPSLGLSRPRRPPPRTPPVPAACRPRRRSPAQGGARRASRLCGI